MNESTIEKCATIRSIIVLQNITVWMLSRGHSIWRGRERGRVVEKSRLTGVKSQIMICSSHGRRAARAGKAWWSTYGALLNFFFGLFLSFHQSIYTTKPIGGTQDPFIVAKAIVESIGRIMLGEKLRKYSHLQNERTPRHARKRPCP